VKINLLPPPPPLIRLRVQVLLLLMVLLIALCVTLGLAWYTTLLQLNAQRFALNTNQLALQDLTQRSKVAQQLINAQARDEQIQQLLQAAPMPAEVIRSLGTDVSPWGKLLSVNINQGVLTGEALVKSYIDAGEFVHVLNQDPHVSSVTIVSMAVDTGSTTGGSSSASGGLILPAAAQSLIGSLGSLGNLLGTNSTTGKAAHVNVSIGITIQFTATPMAQTTQSGPAVGAASAKGAAP